MEEFARSILRTLFELGKVSVERIFREKSFVNWELDEKRDLEELKVVNRLELSP